MKLGEYLFMSRDIRYDELSFEKWRLFHVYRGVNYSPLYNEKPRWVE